MLARMLMLMLVLVLMLMLGKQSDYAALAAGSAVSRHC